MKLLNKLYGYLGSHQATRDDPYFDKRRPWSPLCHYLFRTWFKDWIALEVQVAQLEKKLEKAKADAEYVKKYLCTAERTGELSFGMALQLCGLWLNDASEMCALYPEKDEVAENPLLSISDEEFAGYTLVPAHIIREQV